MSSSSFSANFLNVGVPQSPIPLHLCAPSGRASFNQHQYLQSHIYITDLFFHSHSRPCIFVLLTSPTEVTAYLNPTCSRHNESFISLSQTYLPLLGSWLLTSYSTELYKPESQELLQISSSSLPSIIKSQHFLTPYQLLLSVHSSLEPLSMLYFRNTLFLLKCNHFFSVASSLLSLKIPSLIFILTYWLE